MYQLYQVITGAEATTLWSLHESTVRQAVRDGRFPAQRSGKTWLVTTSDMVEHYGPPKPASSPTSGQTFYLADDSTSTPLEDIGHVTGREDRGVLQSPDGLILVVSRDRLRLVR